MVLIWAVVVVALWKVSWALAGLLESFILGDGEVG